MRIIRSCRELGIQTVAVYSEVDATAQHVQLADEAHLIGLPEPAASYLNRARLIEVALSSGCDCVHPGYGFLSESVDFAEAVINAGLTWVGPGPDAIRLMGVKTTARTLMEQAGVPVIPGFQADGAADADYQAAAETIGYPVLVKAAGGGGGKGMRIVNDTAQLIDALASARQEAQTAFGDNRIFLEKFIERARHIEIQVLADQHGNTRHLFERECSAQRRHQKIIEESPAPLLAADLRTRMSEAAITAAQAVNYVNAGTVEFIVTPDDEFYFLEMNTRLQVEHPVTELVTGVDLVALQFAVAAGDTLSFKQSDLSQRGHAIECRIYAEDPQENFLPAVGRLLRFIPPEGPGIRVDAGVQTGDEISIYYDSLFAKICVHAATRPQAIRRMQTVLASTVILGTTTNLAFLQRLLQHPAFGNGTIDTRFVERHLPELLPETPELPEAALIVAALHDLHTINTKGTIVPADSQDPWSRADRFRLGH